MPRSIVVAAALLAIAVAASTRAQPAPPTAAQRAHALGERYRDGRDISGRTAHRAILFTFDDGPRAPHTLTLLDHLDREGVKAIFFVNGYRFRLPENEAIAREIVRRGHMVGNHTMHHPRGYAGLPMADKAREIDDARAEIERVLGSRSYLFRSPGGAHSRGIERLVAERGYTWVGYNQGGFSWRMTRTEDIVEEILAALDRHERNERVRGGIVAMHDTSAAAVAAFPLVMARLRARNCDLLSRPGEELYEVVSDLDLFFEPRAGAAAGVDAREPALDPAALAARQARVRADAERRCGDDPPRARR